MTRARPRVRPPARRPRVPPAFVYVLRCGDGSLYTGVARDVEARLRQHQAGRASRYTRSHLPVALAWSRRCKTWGDALREEHRIKRLKRADKEALIAVTHPHRAPRRRRVD